MGILFWLTVAPAIAALLVLVSPKQNFGVHRGFALLGVLSPLVLTVIALCNFNFHNGGFQYLTGFTWFDLPNLAQNDVAVGLTFGVDGLSMTLLTLAIVVSLIAVLSVKRPRDRSKAYFFWLLLATAGVFTVFSAQDLFTFVVGLELSLFSTFFLLYLFGDRRSAAFKFLIYRGLASVFLIAALIYLAYAPTGEFGTGGGTPIPMTFNILTLMAHKPGSWLSPGIASAVFIVLLLAVFIEEGFVPLHTWLPTAHESGDTATNVLLGGVLTKTGAYILLRFGVGFLPQQVSHWGYLVGLLGAINILYGAFAAWAQKDWRRLIAFGSISHMGLVLLGVAALNSAGLQGAMFMIVSSGLLSALLFFITGAIKERTGSLKMDELGGLSKSLPMLSGFLLVAALGSLGLPLTSGFISEIQTFIGGFGAYPVLSFVAALGVILSAVYLLYAMQKTTFGPMVSRFADLYDARASEYVPILVLTVLVLLIGIYPSVIGNLLGLSVNTLLGIGG